MKVLVLGASGFVGKHLTNALRERGDTVVTASLRDPAAAADAAADCDAIVNVAGETLAQRWTAAVKARIESSRTELPRRFLEALRSRPHRATAYLSSSAVGYYGTSETETFDERSPAGNDFLARVCQGWEAQAFAARELGMRVAVLRAGIVLGTDGGALAKMLPPFRAGMGGVAGSGRQWLSWIHIDDLVRVTLLALDRGDGPIDATAPRPVTNAEFTRALASALGRPAIASLPAFAVKMMLGEGATIVLEGQRVLPERLVREYAYSFTYPEVEGALRNLLH